MNENKWRNGCLLGKMILEFAETLYTNFFNWKNKRKKS